MPPLIVLSSDSIERINSSSSSIDLPIMSKQPHAEPKQDADVEEEFVAALGKSFARFSGSSSLLNTLYKYR